MSASSNLISEAAERLHAAETSGRACAPVIDLIAPGDVEAAYSVQEFNTLRGLAAGRRLVGRKIGLTAASVQKQLGVDQPDFGMLFADMGVLNGETVSAGRLLQPKVEAEIAFVMRAGVDLVDATVTEVMAAIDYCLPALEIVDSRIADWKISISDTIADNASSGLFVLGASPRRISELDLGACSMVLSCNGEPASFGAGVACLGHPLNAMVWLARQMARVGRPLDAGDIVLSGALGPMVAAMPGDRFEARIGDLGDVSVRFGA